MAANAKFMLIGLAELFVYRDVRPSMLQDVTETTSYFQLICLPSSWFLLLLWRVHITTFKPVNQNTNFRTYKIRPLTVNEEYITPIYSSSLIHFHRVVPLGGPGLNELSPLHTPFLLMATAPCNRSTHPCLMPGTSPVHTQQEAGTFLLPTIILPGMAHHGPSVSTCRIKEGQRTAFREFAGATYSVWITPQPFTKTKMLGCFKTSLLKITCYFNEFRKYIKIVCL